MTKGGASTLTIEDLFDFYQRWPVLRPQMVRLVASRRLGADERTILSAMIDLVDRVGPIDLSQDPDPSNSP